MRHLWRRRGQDAGWLAISLRPGALSFAHAALAGGTWRVSRCGTAQAGDDQGEIQRAARQFGFDRYRCLTVLPSTDYQLMLVDAPDVPEAEMKTALRWRVKDMLEHRVEEATIEMLDIPPDAPGRAHSVYAIAARNDTLRSCIARFEDAGIALSVIDIAETAQRNIAALYEVPNRALAFLFVAESHALLTINYRTELYLARRIEMGMQALSNDAADEAKSRILLEAQRSLDHFDRQFPALNVLKLVIGPEPRGTGLAEYLAANMDLPVEPSRLREKLQFGEACAQDDESLWRLFPVIGAALRTNGESTRSAS